MAKLFTKNLWFYLPYLIFIFLAGLLLLLFPKNDIHIYTNSIHCEVADFYFKYATHLGDGITVGVAILLLLFYRYRYAIVMAISTLFVTIIVQAFKRYILPDIARPKLAFENIYQLHYVSGVDVHITHSFPSGHSASGFSIFILFALIAKNNYLKLLFFILAFSIALSRMYLSQHFLNDIYFGSLIAVVIGSFSFLWVNSWNNNKLDSSFFNVLRTKRNVKN